MWPNRPLGTGLMLPVLAGRLSVFTRTPAFPAPRAGEAPRLRSAAQGCHGPQGGHDRCLVSGPTRPQPAAPRRLAAGVASAQMRSLPAPAGDRHLDAPSGRAMFQMCGVFAEFERVGFKIYRAALFEDRIKLRRCLKCRTVHENARFRPLSGPRSGKAGRPVARTTQGINRNSAQCARLQRQTRNSGPGLQTTAGGHAHLSPRRLIKRANEPRNRLRWLPGPHAFNRLKRSRRARRSKQTRR